MVKETIKFMRAVTLQKADSLTEEVTRDNSIQVGGTHSRAAPPAAALRCAYCGVLLRHAAAPALGPLGFL